MTQDNSDDVGQQRSQAIADGHTTVSVALDPEWRATAIGENLGDSGPYIITYA